MGRKLFGTDGIRGVAGKYPLDEQTVRAFGVALGEWAAAHGETPHVVIGMDTRESGPQLAEWAAAGLRAAGVVPEHHGILSTPGVAWLTKNGPYVAGLMISASHNPYKDNGLKVFAHTGYKLPDEEEKQLEERIFEQIALLGGQGSGDCTRGDGAQQYLQFLKSTFPHTLSGRKIVVDCANGAAYQLAPQLLQELGAEVVAIHNAPNGSNINLECGATHVEDLQKAVVAEKAWMGVAFDGDADRAMFVSGSGQIIDGDRVLLLLARDWKSRGELPGDMVVATVMSNLGLEIALRNLGITLLRTAVGDKYVLEEMIRKGAAVGGEQSGHLICHQYATTGDGMLTLLRVLEVMVRNQQGLDELTAEFHEMPQLLVNVRFKEKRPLEQLSSVQQAISACQEEFSSNGRVVVRFSGTEPLARVMVEGPTMERVQFHAHQIAELIQQELS